jgi:ribosomal protein S18 acetylase RimI-like enzyme
MTGVTGDQGGDEASLLALRAYGSSTRLWSSGGRHEVGETWWLALSGEPSINFNLACSWADDPDLLVSRCLQPVIETRRPAIIMLAGLGLSTAATLVDAGWVKIGTSPMMTAAARTRARTFDPSVRFLTSNDLVTARELLVDVFRMDASNARVAMPDTVVERDDMHAWGLFDGPELLGTIMVVNEDRFAVVWSMAVSPHRQREGFGRRLFETVLHQIDGSDVNSLVLSASGAGEGFYRAAGFELSTELQLWSRPRWMLAVD